MPRVYGYWPGNSSARFGRSSAVYSGRSGMPEMVEASSPSSRTGPDSNSSCHTSSGEAGGGAVRTGFFLALNFSSIIGGGSEDLLRRTVRRPIAKQAVRQAGIVLQRLACTLAGQLRRDLRRLVAQARGGQRRGAAARLEVLAVRQHRLPQLLDPLLADGHGGDDGGLPRTSRGHVQHGAQLRKDTGMAIDVRLVDSEHVGDFEDPGLDHLH